jgi:alpha-glucosidase
MTLSQSASGAPEWWRGAVIYQVYPRSFQDSNGDGVGDLLGIVERLPYVAGLGVDAVWIAPFFTSPMKDFGYDVSDYCDVDPLFGSLADFEAVVSTAHALGLRVMIDLVLSHTSDHHPWFVESRSSRDNPRADWFVWADPKPDGTPPNNWLSFFGGSAWAWDTTRCQYYLHNFLDSQPDLNFHNPAVQDAVLDVARFWLDRGVDGFRLDTINFYFADKALRDNPPLPPEQRSETIAPKVNPYNYQLHLHSKNQPENLAFLRRLRALTDRYDAAMLGEVGDAQNGLKILGDYTSGGDKAQMCYAFEFLAAEQPTAARLAEVLHLKQRVAADGWACWAFSNHDVMRHVSRWHLTPAAARCYATLLLCLEGSVCLYQGEELGLPEAELRLEDLRDPYGIRFWPEYRGRDGARTPMVWQAHALNAGFSPGIPWLPITSEHAALSVEAQDMAPEALLHHYRRAIAFRAAHPLLRTGTIEDVTAEGPVLRFLRRGDGERMFCAFNLGQEPATITLPGDGWHHVGAELNSAGASPEGRVPMGPWQPCLALARD